MKTIEITISPNGKTTIQTKGFSGSECRDASRFLERSLGEKSSELFTVEFHQHETHHEIRQQSY